MAEVKHESLSDMILSDFVRQEERFLNLQKVCIVALGVLTLGLWGAREYETRSLRKQESIQQSYEVCRYTWDKVQIRQLPYGRYSCQEIDGLYSSLK